MGEGPFRIHAVSELTGVPTPTLRAWERRYGIPTPERTASGYRLYGAREIAQVREMRRLTEGGIAAADAAQRALDGAAVERRPPAPEGDAWSMSVRAILDAVVRHDDRALADEARKLPFLGTPTVVLDRVLVPALREVGDRWHRGELSIAQEHLARGVLTPTFHDLLRLSTSTDADVRVVLACFEDDEHELGLLATATRLAAWGLAPIFLGARTPPSAIADAVAGFRPRVIALSTTIAPPRERRRPLLAEYARAAGGTPWMVGGAAVSAIADAVRAAGGHVAPESPAELRTLFHHLAAAPPPQRGKRR